MQCNNFLATNSQNSGVLVGPCECLSLWPYQAMIYVSRNYYVPSSYFDSLLFELRECPGIRAGLFPIAVRGCAE